MNPTSILPVGCLLLGFSIRRRELSPRKWRQTPGRIISSTTENRPRNQGRHVVLPIIEYEFVQESGLIRSSHWRVGNFSLGNRDSAEAVTSRYIEGSPVTVFVHPKDPAKSVLEYGTTAMSWIPLGFGMGFVGLALLSILSKK